MRNEKELKQRLLDPLKIEKVNTGNEDFGVIGDIAITPRDMVKFGLLYLNDGIWNGKQIIPANWVKESTTRRFKLAAMKATDIFGGLKSLIQMDQPSTPTMPGAMVANIFL